MKRVTVKVAKALKEAGYPIEIKSIEEAEKLGWQGNAFFTGMSTCGLCPYVMEAWLWLWREKKECIHIMTDMYADCCAVCENGYIISEFADPEEAIIGAIEYLVEHKLLN